MLLKKSPCPGLCMLIPPIEKKLNVTGSSTIYQEKAKFNKERTEYFLCNMCVFWSNRNPTMQATFLKKKLNVTKTELNLFYLTGIYFCPSAIY